MSQIQQRSKIFRVLFQILFWLPPIMILMKWISPWHFAANMWTQNGDHFVQLTFFMQFAGFLIGMLPAAVVMFAFYQLVKIFKNYENNAVFVLENAQRYQKLGYALIVFVIFRIISEIAIGKMIQFFAYPAHLGFSIGFDTADLTLVVVGAIIILISSVMREASQLAAAHAEII